MSTPPVGRPKNLDNAINDLLQGRSLSDIPEEAAEIIEELYEEAIIQKAREDFYTYVKIMAEEAIPDEFKDGQHIRYICSQLQLVAEGKLKRLQIFLPPGSMKSVLTSQLFPSWMFGRDAKKRIIGIGHSTQFAEDNLGRPVKDLMSTDKYRKIFPKTTVRKDIRAAGRWTTEQGGTYYCTGAGGKIAGRRAHITICDDVLSEQEAYSDVKRKAVNEWYGPGLRTRLLPGGAEIIINTRWHVDDISGRTLEDAKKNPRAGQWKVISVPAILGEDDKEMCDILGRKPGDSFWPELWPIDILKGLKEDGSMTPQKWAALYMQNPVPEEGNIIKEEHWRAWPHDEPPQCDYILISCDTAFSIKESADYSAITVWGIFHRLERLSDGSEVMASNLILLSAEKGRWEFPDLVAKVEQTYKMNNADVVIIEKKASGQSLIQEVRRRGIPFYEYLPDRDKVSRAHAATPIMSAGRVWIPDPALGYEWVHDVILETTQFPHAQHDDYVDTVTQAVIWMRDSWRIQHPDDWEDDEDPSVWKRKRKSYWSAS